MLTTNEAFFCFLSLIWDALASAHFGKLMARNTNLINFLNEKEEQ